MQACRISIRPVQVPDASLPNLDTAPAMLLDATPPKLDTTHRTRLRILPLATGGAGGKDGGTGEPEEQRASIGSAIVLLRTGRGDAARWRKVRTGAMRIHLRDPQGGLEYDVGLLPGIGGTTMEASSPHDLLSAVTPAVFGSKTVTSTAARTCCREVDPSRQRILVITVGVTGPERHQRGGQQC